MSESLDWSDLTWSDVTFSSVNDFTCPAQSVQSPRLPVFFWFPPPFFSVGMHKIITPFKTLEMCPLLTPKFSLDLKSASCNANAINVVFTETDTHVCTDTQERTENVSCLFISCCLVWWRHKIRGYRTREDSIGHLFCFLFSYHNLSSQSERETDGERERGPNIKKKILLSLCLFERVAGWPLEEDFSEHWASGDF